MDFIDLKTQQASIRTKIEARIQRVLNHGKYIMGPEVFELEERLAKFIGVRYCISCSSGTDALLMALMALEVGPGDAVFTTPFTFIATSEVIQLLGATPVFVDIDESTYNIDSIKLESEIKTVLNKGELKPRVILPVDLYGLPANYNEIERLAKKYNLKIIEDAAQGFGGSINGQKAGSFGDVGITSFFPAKPLGCYGDGGAIFTDNKDMAGILCSIRVHGKGAHKYDNARIGINGRLDTLQAAILLEKLEIFPNELQLRNEIASDYSSLLSNTVVVPTVPDGYISAWAQYSILARNSNEREKYQKKLKEKDIPTAIYYPKPLHLQSAFSRLGYSVGDFPISESISQRIFSLPMHPYINNDEIKFISESIMGI